MQKPANHNSQHNQPKQLQVNRQLLQQQALFKHLTPQEFDQILPLLKFNHYNANDILISQGQLSGGIFILLKGQLKVYTTDMENRETGLSYITESDFFGELSVIDSTPSTVNIRASVDSIVLIIPADLSISLMQQKPQFTYELLLKQAKTIRTSNDRFIMLQSKSGKRLFYFLKSTASRIEGLELFGPLAKHEEIAAMTNLSRETVTRILSKFKKAGWLRIYKTDSGKEFMIDQSKVDIEKL